MQDRLEYAERRLEEEIKNGEMCDIQYWRGYCDGTKRMVEDLKNRYITACPKCGSYGLRHMKICSDTVPLMECVVCGWNSILPGETEEQNNEEV